MSISAIAIISLISVMAPVPVPSTVQALNTVHHATATQEEPQPQNKSGTIKQIIESYVTDFRADRFAAKPMLFGIEIPGEGKWHVRVTGKKNDSDWEVELGEGPAPEPTFIYKIEAETLRAMNQGAINPLTAQGKAFSGDYTPMSISQMEGYSPTLQQNAAINPFSFHFWTRGFPEVIPFGEGLTREAHGANFVVFYYEKGLRTAWTRVVPGGRVRDDPREQAMPFPMLIVGVEGTAEGEVDGRRVTLPAGNAVFVPPNVNHLWWNDTDKPAAAILIMFGEGA